MSSSCTDPNDSQAESENNFLASYMMEVEDDNVQPRPQGHLCGRAEEIDDPGKGCKNLQDSW